jgi:hypothetical protein
MYKISSDVSRAVGKDIFNLEPGENKIFAGHLHQEILRFIEGLSFYEVSLEFGQVVVTHIDPNPEQDPGDPLETAFLVEDDIEE